MYIKHSKFKNTGLLFELLIRQVTMDTLAKKESPALHLIKKYFSGSTLLAKELKLYEQVLKNRNTSAARAETILNTLLEISRKFNIKELRNEKFHLVREIADHYNPDTFFNIKIPEYKPLAALYCLLESYRSNELVDPSTIVKNRGVLLEYLTLKPQTEEQNTEDLLKEFRKYDKDLRILTYKILLEKFNNAYQDLLPEQKLLLNKFITLSNSNGSLPKYVSECAIDLKEKIKQNYSKVNNGVVNIKLQEVATLLDTFVPTMKKVEEKHLVILMEYYDLLYELEQFS